MTLERNWQKTFRRFLTLCGLIAITLSTTGCQGMRGCCGVPVLNARICPTCNARTVRECRCFTAYDNAGYTETSWTSLGPTCYGNIGPADNSPGNYLPNDIGPVYSQEQETLPLPKSQPSLIGQESHAEAGSPVRTISDVINASHDEYFRP